MSAKSFIALAIASGVAAGLLFSSVVFAKEATPQLMEAISIKDQVSPFFFSMRGVTLVSVQDCAVDFSKFDKAHRNHISDPKLYCGCAGAGAAAPASGSIRPGGSCPLKAA